MYQDFSKLAEKLTTSPILTFAGEINARKAKGEKIFNLTIGDFDPKIYPVPDKLKTEIIKAYKDDLTSYPGAFGLDNLRSGIKRLLEDKCEVKHDINNIQVASGSRALIYSTFRAILDEGDKVLFPVPSWNNDFYSLLAGANTIEIETTSDNNFMPTKDDLEPHIKDANLLALCSPQNPTGTVLSRQQLTDICKLVVNENKRRAGKQKPLYVMFDQVYWLLSFYPDVFFHAESINPEIHDYAIFIDGMSKAFAGTGVRVGWGTGPSHIIGKIRSLIAHIGAWAPTPEQYATGVFLQNKNLTDEYLLTFTDRLKTVLDKLYTGFSKMAKGGLPVAAIKPEASIYLSVKLDLIGKTTPDGKTLAGGDDVCSYMLESGKIGILPFSWFGARSSDSWFRISIGTCKEDEVEEILDNFKTAIKKLK